MNSCAIIGGGIVGLAVAYKLGRAYPGLQLTLLEKEKAVGRHQSTHNSGVLHAGLYYVPGSGKARLAVSGIKQMTAFCREHGIAHEICGKLVIATTDAEIPRLKTLLERGTANGLKDLQWLNREQIHEREPHAAGTAAVLVPEEGIVDYAAVCEILRREILNAGGTIHLDFAVDRMERKGAVWRIGTNLQDRAVECDFLINCAGLQCDRIGELAGRPRTTRIVPFRGEYYKIRPERSHLVRHLIYPVPDPAFPFLGVHFTRLIHGGIEAGPNAVLALKREGYHRLDFARADAWDALSFPGLWRFMGRHYRACGHELARSFSKKLFCRALQKLVPGIREDDLTEGGSGVRAQAMSGDGELQQDFNIQTDHHALHLLNAPSPAATASLAIADEILARMQGVPIHG